MKTIKTITIVTSLALSSVSFAGTVKLVSKHWNNICKVQVSKGNNAPANGYLSTYTNVGKNFSTSGTNRLCYRRSANPNDCNSNYAGWVCDTRNTTGTTILELR